MDLFKISQRKLVKIMRRCQRASLNNLYQFAADILDKDANMALFTKLAYANVAIIGFVLSCTWAEINFRSREMMFYWHDRLALMEPPEDSPLIVYRVFTGIDWEETHEPFLFPMIVLRMSLPGLFIFGWIVVFLVSRFL